MTYIGSNNIITAENELAGMMHGSTIKQLQNPYGVFNRAARRVLTDVDPWETKIALEIGAVFDEVFDYSAPTDLKGNKIIDIYPQVARTSLDNFGQSYNKAFDINKDVTLSPQFTLTASGGQRTLRINATNQVTGIPVNLIESITGNGTFSVGDNAANLLNDYLYYVAQTASSISFNLNAAAPGSTGYVENSTMSAIDLTTHLNQATEFIYLWLPTGASITSVELRWGSSATAYWKQTATTQYGGNAFINGWNLISFPWVSATKVLSPNVASITYMRCTLTYDGTLQTAIRINDFQSRLGQILMLEYYSKFLFRNATTNVMQETVLTDNDIIQLDTDSYDLWLMATASEIVQQTQGIDALFYDDQHFEDRYQNSLAAYRSKYKSEITKPRETYYSLPRSSRRRWFGSRWNIG